LTEKRDGHGRPHPSPWAFDKKKNEMEREERVGFEEIRMEDIRVKG
jgi:hypothetical protein